MHPWRGLAQPCTSVAQMISGVSFGFRLFVDLGCLSSCFPRPKTHIPAAALRMYYLLSPILGWPLKPPEKYSFRV